MITIEDLKERWFNAYPEAMGISGDKPIQCYGKKDVDECLDGIMSVPRTDNSAVIAKPLDERRWRKFSEDKPNDEGDYLVMACYPDEDEPHIEICFYDRNCEDFGHYERRYSGSGNSFGGFDGEEWVTHHVTFWMPLPSAPKDDDK